MKRIIKPISALLITAMLFAVCSCDGQAEMPSAAENQWLDSNLFENVERMAEAELKDDFAAAANYEWASQQVEDYTYEISTFGEAAHNVDRNKLAMIADESFQNKNIEVVRTAYELFSDWDYRDSLGVEPLLKYFAYIDEIESVDDVSAYMIDNGKNPFAMTLVEMKNVFVEASSDSQTLLITRPELSLEEPDYYVYMSQKAYVKKDALETEMRYVLGRCGYSESEIEKTINDCLSFESKMVNLDIADKPNYSTGRPMSEVLGIAGNYPLDQMFDHYHITNCDHITGEFSFLDKLENIYTQSNVEGMKAYFKIRLARNAIYYLDAGCYDILMDSQVDRSNQFSERIDNDPDFYYFKLIRGTALTAAMDQAYLDYYFDQDVYDEVIGFIHLVKEKYEILINESEHLSAESKAAVCEKLEAIRENVITPSNTADFTGVDLKTKEEGGTYLDAMCELSRAKYEHVGEMVQMQLDRSFWDIYDGNLSTTATAANYYDKQNSFFIQMGIVTDPFYSPDYSIEQKLGHFVAIIGHEVSHAFDINGIASDKDGVPKQLVSSDEMAFWRATSIRITNFFSGIHPFEGSGSYGLTSDITGEVIADIEGLKVSLMIAGDCDDFDYDLFFRSYAGNWNLITTKGKQVELIATNEHPLSYLRANYTVMQFDEFIDTYGVQPGDGMYLAPDQRTVIW